MSVSAQQTGAKYVLESLAGRAVFNDPTDVDYVGVFTGEDAITGLDSPEVRAAVFDKVEADGSIFGNFYHGNRPVTLQGALNAPTVTERNVRESRLNAVINSALRTTGRLIWTPEGGDEQYVAVRKFQPTRIKGGWVKNFMVSLIAADPYIYGTTEKESADTSLGSSVVVTNDGTAPREPHLIRIRGATSAPPTLRVTNSAGEFQVAFIAGTPNLAAAEALRVDPLRRTVTLHPTHADADNDANGTNWYRYLDYVNTTWPLLYPGDNTFDHTGGSSGSFLVSSRDTWV